MIKSDLFWQTYLNLEKEAIELSKYIFFTDVKLVNGNDGRAVVQPCNTQMETFSPYIADLLVRCCVQIEALSKELYFENGGTKTRGDSSILFDEDCLKQIDIKWHVHDKVVLVVAPSFNFSNDENLILKPLKNAHKRQGTDWERTYQAVKHDRYSSLYKGNVKVFLHALAALFLLNVYYRNVSWEMKYQDISKLDISLGSGVFSVKPPVIAQQLWYGNDAVISESPYVVKYNDNDYHHIIEVQQTEDKALKDYWLQQPELQEEDFTAQIQAKMAKDPKQKIMGLWELGIYRLNKRIPNNLTFDKRKELLINSKEWNGWIHQHNKHLEGEDLTEENIQSEIDNVGMLLAWK